MYKLGVVVTVCHVFSLSGVYILGVVGQRLEITQHVHLITQHRKLHNTGESHNMYKFGVLSRHRKSHNTYI